MKIDLHIHSKYSSDSDSEPYKIIQIAKKKGLDGVAITDHNNSNGWKEMLQMGKKYGIKVVLGEEIKIKDSFGSYEIMALFLNEEIKSNDLDEVIDNIRQQNAIACISHPFDPYKTHINAINKLAKKVDAIEIFNARMISNSFNNKALVLAKKHKLGIIAGSDAHTEGEVGNAYTIADVNSLEDFKKAILKRETRVEGKLMNPVKRLIKKVRRNKSIKRIF